MTRIGTRAAGACIALAAWLAITGSVQAARVAPARARVEAVLVAGGLDQPVAFTFGPKHRVWYVEKTSGEIRILNLSSGHDRLFDRVGGVNGEGERGMLGIALHPDYPNHPYVYVYATRSTDGRLRNQILRITDRGGHGKGSKVVFSADASSSPYHNGGRIFFGPDGMLYAVVGEGHDPGNSQDLSKNDQGKILRLAPTGGVPEDNPFHGSRIFAYGIRNSFGFAFDPVSGSLWETDNGPECNDEVNLIVAGDNYGWGPHETCEGQSPENTNQDGPNPHLPKLFYRNTIGITGMAFCDGCGLGSASEGAIFFGDVNNGDITRATLNGARDEIADHSVVYRHGQGVLSLEVAPDGAIYFSDFGAIYKLGAG